MSDWETLKQMVEPWWSGALGPTLRSTCLRILMESRFIYFIYMTQIWGSCGLKVGIADLLPRVPAGEMNKQQSLVTLPLPSPQSAFQRETESELLSKKRRR